MQARPFWMVVSLMLGIALMLATGCPTDDDDDATADDDDASADDDDDAVEPMVEISGDHGVEIDATVELAATTVDGTDAGYTWASANDNVATVDADGVVTGVAGGETTITATGDDSGAEGEHAVVVIEITSGDAVVVVTGDFVVTVGMTTTLTAETVNGEDTAYTWTSGDETIATVDEDGVVTGAEAGEVSITATGDDTGAAGSFGVVVTEEDMDIPGYEDWLMSAHADATAEAFVHWDDDGAVSASCAKCHSTYGMLDFLGEDGTDFGSVENDAALGSTIECQACHNPTAIGLTSVEFPSGAIIEDLGSEARCMLCHQGRESTDSVDTAIEDAAIVDEDTADEDLGFENVHYFAAGATMYAGLARGGYQYADAEAYDVRFRHVPSHDTCFECHDQHTLEVQVDTCQTCHPTLLTADDAKDIRMMPSATRDYDGDGDLSEGVYHEIETLRETLYSSLQAYAGDVGVDDICYEAHTYPYFFIDTDGSGGACDASEATYANGYASWTARMLRAAYNYQYSLKDTGAHAHNAKYVIQLLFDSIADLNTALSSPVDMSAMVRNDGGHFDGAGEAARHWDEDEPAVVSDSCSKCHAGDEGFDFWLAYGVGKETELGNGMECTVCHDDQTFDAIELETVLYPSDVEIEHGAAASNVCRTCHSGREAKEDIDGEIASGDFGFQNVHYMPAAAVQAGSDATVGYEYDGMTYAASFVHAVGSDCTYCHSPADTTHTFHVDDNMGTCSTCHVGAVEPHDIRGFTNTTDWDGDGDATEALEDEVSTFAEAVYVAMQAEGTAIGFPICYDAHAYPYFFNDSDGNDLCDNGEANYGNRYTDWNPALLKASHNYQIFQKDHGAWAHNFEYMLQLLFDSTDDLGGDVSDLTRP